MPCRCICGCTAISKCRACDDILKLLHFCTVEFFLKDNCNVIAFSCIFKEFTFILYLVERSNQLKFALLDQNNMVYNLLREKLWHWRGQGRLHLKYESNIHDVLLQTNL